jgi:hypothetical protein
MPDFDWRKDRFFVSPAVHPWPDAKEGIPEIDKSSRWRAAILRSNLNMLYQLPSIDGDAGLILRAYQDFFQTGSTDPAAVNYGDLFSNQKMDLLGIKYILSKNPDPNLEADSRFSRLFMIGERALYLNENAYPRFFAKSGNKILFDEVSIKSYTTNKVELAVSFDEPTRLIFTDTNYPGWKVWVDGSREDIIPFEVFKSVNVAEGKHDVVFKFQPQSITWGLGLTTLGLAFFVSAIFWKSSI